MILLYVINAKLLSPFSMVPVTDSKFSDMDQATALGIALFSIAWKWRASRGVKMLRLVIKKIARMGNNFLKATAVLILKAVKKLINKAGKALPTLATNQHGIRTNTHGEPPGGEHELQPMAHGALSPDTAIQPIPRAVLSQRTP